jgi:Glycosyl transferase family 2
MVGELCAFDQFEWNHELEVRWHLAETEAPHLFPYGMEEDLEALPSTVEATSAEILQHLGHHKPARLARLCRHLKAHRDAMRLILERVGWFAALEKHRKRDLALQRRDVAVLVPCLNEAGAIGHVVRAFRGALPDAVVYVYDNGSTDGTVAEAVAAGAIVRHEPRRGKGNVVRRMFADVEADVYVLVDGDDTYDAAAAPVMIAMLLEGSLDLINGVRLPAEEAAAFPRGHKFGNRLLSGLAATVFGQRMDDMLSGYKIFSRRFVKSFPALSSGFEIETEIMVHALVLRMPAAEVATSYRERASGTRSKLHTWRDGFRILRTIIILLKEERPMQFFSAIFAFLAMIAIVVSVPLLVTFLETGLVPRLPTAVLATGLMLLAFLSLTCGMILDTVTHGRREQRRIAYLETPAPAAPSRTACRSMPTAPKS